MSQHISIRSDVNHFNDIEVLRETIARFQRMFNGSGYGFWEWDLYSQKIDWSGGFW